MIVKTVDWAKRNIGRIYIFTFTAWVTKRKKRRRVRLIKIGTSLNPQRRLKQFRQALSKQDRSSLRKVVSFSVFAPYKKEKGFLHQKFKDNQVTPIGIKPGSGGEECFDLNALQIAFVFAYLSFWWLIFISTWVLPTAVVILYYLNSKP